MEKQEFISKEFGVLFRRHLNEKFADVAQVAKHLSFHLPGSFATFREDLRNYRGGNLLGRKVHLTLNGKPLEIYIKKFAFDMCTCLIDESSEVIEVARREFGVNFEYPPRGEYPFGQNYNGRKITTTKMVNIF